MSFDPDAHRQASLETWEEAAPGWVRRHELMSGWAARVSHWMLDALSLQPGQRVLELAGGIGETGMLAAELVAPMGSVTISDQAEAMLEGARARAQELGVANVEFQVLNAEWIDLPLASVDAVLCRWGYMLMADPAAALGETRRVLRPGGRVALAVWDAIESNPWALLPGPGARRARPRGVLPARAPSISQGRSRWAIPMSSAELLAASRLHRDRRRGARARRAGTRASRSCGRRRSTSRAASTTRCSPVPPRRSMRSKPSLAERFAPYTAADGTLEVPARTLVASASA